MTMSTNMTTNSRKLQNTSAPSLGGKYSAFSCYRKQVLHSKHHSRPRVPRILGFLEMTLHPEITLREVIQQDMGASKEDTTSRLRDQ